MIEIFTLILQCYVFEAILEERKIYEKNRRRRPKEFREWNYDSLKISNGKWMWWSQRTGGRSALDYLIKVRGYSFLEAVELLAERANIQPPLFVSENVPMEKQLLLPRKNQDNQKVIAYLSERGIDNEIIQFCLESGRVYESEFHHNTVFVGMDEKGNSKYAAIRGIGTSFIGEANGSFPFLQKNPMIRCICLSQSLICYLSIRIGGKTNFKMVR